MVQVKILLEEDEQLEDVRDDIIKALGDSVDIHDHIDNDHRPFQDSVLQDIHETLNKEFSNMFNSMFEEIEVVIANPHLSDHY